MHLLQMRWRDVLFVHWAVAPEVVTPRLPDGLQAATHDGDAWLGVVCFEMTDVRPRGVPVGRSFPELNLRTYVTRPGADDHGVYFFSLDAPDRMGVAVARRVLRLPYYRAEMRLTREDEAMTLRSRRTHSDAPAARFEATYRPTGAGATPDPGRLEHFLTENYRFYTEGDRLFYGDIAHSPWSVADATADIESNTLFAANGFKQPASEPVVHYSPGIDVRADGLRSV